MEALGAYVLRACCAALIAGIVGSIGGDGPGSKVRKVICGLFLAFVVISPLREIELDELWELPQELYEEGEGIASAAQADVNSEISDIIIERTRSYILDEADALGVQLQVEAIALDPDTLSPCSVELSGDISPYERSRLSEYIRDTLGIEKEAQKWNQ